MIFKNQWKQFFRFFGQDQDSLLVRYVVVQLKIFAPLFVSSIYIHVHVEVQDFCLHSFFEA